MATTDQRDSHRSEPLPVPELPPRLLLDLRTDCNLKCPMCIVHASPDEGKLSGFLRRNMPLENVRAILDEVTPAKPMMQPSLWSEPTLAPDFRTNIADAKARGIAVAFNTNGLTLREDLADFLVDIKLDSISFSIDAMTAETLQKVRGIDKLQKIHNAVEIMLRAREKAGVELPRIGVSFTVQDTNAHECEAFIAHWIQRVDFVRVAELYVAGTFPNIDVQRERTPCPAIYNTMAIHANGNAAICCLDGFGETNMGNVFEEGVKAVWNGEAFTAARRAHEQGDWDAVPYCKNCDRWASYAYDDVIKDGVLIRKSPEYTYYNRMDKLTNIQKGLIQYDDDARRVIGDLLDEKGA